MPKTICDICMEEYEDKEKSEKCPRILICGHTFCTLCLKSIKLKNASIICPTCRAIDLREVNKITINRVIFDLIWEKKQTINHHSYIDEKVMTIENKEMINKDSILSNYDYTTDYLFKIALIGESFSGKTALSKCFIKGPLNVEENYTITVGLDFFTKIIECQNHLIKLQIWDTAGQERYQSLTSCYLKGVHGCIIVFDITKRNTFEKLDNWIKLFHDFNSYKNNIVIVGNKKDKENRVISNIEAQKFCEQYNYPYFETSALTGENVFLSFECIANKIINSDVIENNNVLLNNKIIKVNTEGNLSCCNV